LADFLIEFSIVLHKRSMYPAGHPHLQDSADRFMRRTQALLKERESVTLGVARHRLVIDRRHTDSRNALLRDLASPAAPSPAGVSAFEPWSHGRESDGLLTH